MGGIKETIGNIIGSTDTAVSGKEQKASGDAEYKAAQAQGYAEGTKDRVGGKVSTYPVDFRVSPSTDGANFSFTPTITSSIRSLELLLEILLRKLPVKRETRRVMLNKLSTRTFRSESPSPHHHPWLPFPSLMPFGTDTLLS